jgi:hypothetical protein
MTGNATPASATLMFPLHIGEPEALRSDTPTLFARLGPLHAILHPIVQPHPQSLQSILGLVNELDELVLDGEANLLIRTLRLARYARSCSARRRRVSS